MKFYKFKSLGSQNKTSCEFQSTNGTTNFVNQITIILLQTANAIIVTDNICHYAAKVLFLSCSQQMYISEQVILIVRKKKCLN